MNRIANVWQQADYRESTFILSSHSNTMPWAASVENVENSQPKCMSFYENIFLPFVVVVGAVIVVVVSVVCLVILSVRLFSFRVCSFFLLLLFSRFVCKLCCFSSITKQWQHWSIYCSWINWTSFKNNCRSIILFHTYTLCVLTIKYYLYCNTCKCCRSNHRVAWIFRLACLT